MECLSDYEKLIEKKELWFLKPFILLSTEEQNKSFGRTSLYIEKAVLVLSICLDPSCLHVSFFFVYGISQFAVQPAKVVNYLTDLPCGCLK